MNEGAAARGVDADARRQLVHDGSLFAIFTDELAASGSEHAADVRRLADVDGEFAAARRDGAADRWERAVVDRCDLAYGCTNAAVGCAVAASG
jgi:hypothetical protein